MVVTAIVDAPSEPSPSSKTSSYEMVDMNKTSVSAVGNFCISDDDDDYNTSFDIFNDEDNNDDVSAALNHINNGESLSSYTPGLTSTDTTNGGYHHSKWIWLHASYHCLVTILGTGILGFPYAFSYLGWIGGMTLILVVTFASLYNALILAELQDINQYTYSQLADSIMMTINSNNANSSSTHIIAGRRRRFSTWYIRPFQFFAFFPTTCVLILIGGQAITSMIVLFQGGVDNNTTMDETTLMLDERIWIFVVGVIVMLLSFAPDLSSAWIISLTGSITAILIPIFCIVESTSYYLNATSDIGDTGGNDLTETIISTNTNLDKIFGIMTSFGSILFGYGFHSLIPDIQSSLHDKNTADAHKDMKKAICASFSWVFPSYVGVAVTGYLAFGNSVQQDILDNLSAVMSNNKISMYAIWIFILFKVSTEAAAYNQAAFTLIKEILLTTSNNNTSSHHHHHQHETLPSTDEHDDDNEHDTSNNRNYGEQPCTTNINNNKEEEDTITSRPKSVATPMTTTKPVHNISTKNNSSNNAADYSKAILPSGKDHYFVIDMIIRIIYVMSATFITIIIPFFADLASICGAIGITPLSFIIPLILWNHKQKHMTSGTGRISVVVRIFVHKVLMALFVIIAICALIGSIENVLSLEEDK